MRFKTLLAELLLLSTEWRVILALWILNTGHSGNSRILVALSNSDSGICMSDP